MDNLTIALVIGAILVVWVDIAREPALPELQVRFPTSSARIRVNLTDTVKYLPNHHS